MKKGFALLETIIVITFLSVSLLMLYGTFSGMIKNSQNNLYYDDASNIYKVAYLKEYLNRYGFNEIKKDENIQELSCNDFSFASCEKLLEKMNIHQMYITKYELNDFNNEYSSMLNNYLASLAINKNDKYRFVVEFLVDDTYSYASLSFGGNSYE